METHWDIQAPTLIGSCVAGAILLLAFSVAYLNWHRGHHPRKDAILLLLRLIILVMIGVTLLRPELVSRKRIIHDPELVVLVDDTESMTTKDVLTPNASVVSRKDWVGNQVKDEFWKPLAETYGVRVEMMSDLIDKTDDVGDQTGTDLNTALTAVSQRHGRLRAVILLSDGDWNMGGSPLSAATDMCLNHTHVYPVAVGSDDYLPDLEILGLKAPAFSIIGETVLITFRVQSRLKKDIRTMITLNSPFGGDLKKDVFIPAGHLINEQVLWKTTRAGAHDLSLSIPVEDDETITTNNERKFSISVRQEVLNVLLIDSMPRWEYRYLRNALMRDPGVSVKTLLMHPGLKRGDGRGYIKDFPSGKDAISEFDVIFLGDVGLGDGELSKEQLDLIRGVVEKQGSGLVFLPGARGRQHTLAPSVLGEMMPVELDPGHRTGFSFRTPSKMNLTRTGADHLLTLLTRSPAGNYTLWKNLPGFYWSAGVLRAKPGADVLAVHGSQRNQWGRLPLLVTQKAGNGNVLFLGTDSAWRWRRGVEDRYHYRFWGQVVRWMAHPRHLSHKDGIRVFYTPENPEQGNTVNFQATVFDGNGFPLTDGTVSASLIRPTKKSEHLALTKIEGGWGVYTGSFVARKAGKYNLVVQAPDVGHRIETDILAAGKTVERIGLPARYGTLKDIARITKGAFATTDELEAVIQQVQALPTDDILVTRFPLWSQWWWGGCILFVMVVFWVFRKLWGHI
ncbi:hypothetical protein BVX99_01650 [bacterium F16]|nr:hypothetical protein BVX99_01650 [bacterium F16]